MDPESAPAVELPVTRGTLFDPPAELARERQQAPVSRLALPDGTFGWLVTSHTAVREALLDQRFSARQELRRMPEGQEAPGAAAPGFFARMDAPDHTRYRRLVARQFTRQRVKDLLPRIEEISDQHVCALLESGSPADLVPSFALPIPSLVICELLGVPYSERANFQKETATTVDLTASPEAVAAAFSRISEFLTGLAADKRARPGDDVISGLTQVEGLTDREIGTMALLLLVAGFETTANMLALGVLTLLVHPEEGERFRSSPSVADTAVDELLRYLTIMQFGAMRVALEDVEFHGRAVRKGEALILHLPAANRDPDQFPKPDTLDLGRPASSHLAFGVGEHHCLGHQLARAELSTAYKTLFRRVPSLRLAEPADRLPMRSAMTIYGPYRLPVTW